MEPFHVITLAIIDPDTLEDAPLETKIRYFYTTRGLYAGVWNEQDKDTLVARLSSRDQFITRDESVLHIIVSL